MLKRVRSFVSLVIFGFVALCDWVKCAVRIKMGTIIDNSDEKKDLDDSGCVQDDSSQNRMADSEEYGVNLLDLSDDVLLYILRHCSPRDLKALGYSCSRLGRLVRERSLWRRVDARSEPVSLARLRWYVAHALHADTRQLFIRGYASESRGCLGLLNCSRQEGEEDLHSHAHPQKSNDPDNGSQPRRPNIQRHHACLYISAHSSSRLPTFRGSPLWADGEQVCRPGHDARCSGPQFSVSEPLLRQLRLRCARLTRLALDGCNINCNTMNLGHLPATLTRLSLSGSKCFNLPIDKSFLFKIQDHLPLLESLDVSDCDWMEPASLLPLSKHKKLKELYMRDCHKLAEFVAYASLSSRYGFRKLQVLDLRGSPVGDSEVAPLAWLPELQELKLSAVTKPPPVKHAHYVDDSTEPRQDLDDWELQEPDYFMTGADDGRMDVDNEGSQHSGDDTDDEDDAEEDDDDDDDDDGDDDMNDNASRVHKPDPHEQPDEGESSKTGRDNAKSKRKSENGSGDASVNGQSKSKRKRDYFKASQHDGGESSKDSEEERYEKRRCQTIVIVDRRSYNGDVSDDDDDMIINSPRRRPRSRVHVLTNASGGSYEEQHAGSSHHCHTNGASYERNEQLRNGCHDARAEENNIDDTKDESQDENMEDGSKNNDNDEDESSSEDEDGEDESQNDETVQNDVTAEEESEEDDKDDKSQEDDRDEEETDGASDDEKQTDTEKINEETENFKHIDLSCDLKPANKYKTKSIIANGAMEVNQGASTSREHPATGTNGNINCNNNNEREERNNNNNNTNNNNGEWLVRFRQGRNPVYVNLNSQQRAPPQQRRTRGDHEHEPGHNVLDLQHRNVHYSIRHEEMNNHRIYNVEVETRKANSIPPNNWPARAAAAPAPRPAPEPQNQARREEEEEVHRRLFERARLMERNPHIMNLIRGIQPPGNPGPLEFPMIPPMPHNPVFPNPAFPPNPVPNVANLPVLEDNRDREPRHRVLYVNVGQPANVLCPLPSVIQSLVLERENRLLNLSRAHLEPSSLVTDSAVRRFGRAAGNDIRFVLVGLPQPFLGPNNDGSARPERSNLRVLVMNGYRNITDRSLIHLATAAPHLRLLDFRETSVTAQGVENFRSLRPDCEVLFSPYVERKVEWPDEDE